MTAAAALWPGTGRLEAWGAFPAVPDLLARGEADAVGDAYRRMAERGELRTYAGRVTPVGEFLAARGGAAGRGAGAGGRGRPLPASQRSLQALEAAGVRWPIQWRGQGASAKADGSHDIRALQRFVLSQRLRCGREPAAGVCHQREQHTPRLRAAIRRWTRAARKGRIDALQAAVIAAGLAELSAGRKPPVRYLGLA